jgi:DNA-binding NarL/FixJ family response regulator
VVGGVVLSHQQVRRAQVLPLAATGEANTRIAERLGLTVVRSAKVETQ